MHGIGRRGLTIAATLAIVALWPAAPASAGGGCHSGATEGTGETVALAMMCFEPGVLRVDPGAQVRFVNKDDMTHNVSANGWGSVGDLGQGDSFTTTFDQEGTYPYACQYHYGMTGAIVVGDGSGPAGATGAVVDTTPVSEERAVTSAGGSDLLGWTIAGLIGILLGAGLTEGLRRARQED
jgi:plastocyanin